LPIERVSCVREWSAVESGVGKRVEWACDECTCDEWTCLVSERALRMSCVICHTLWAYESAVHMRVCIVSQSAVHR